MDLLEQLTNPTVPALQALQLLQHGDGSLTIEAARVSRGKENDRTADSLKVLRIERYLHNARLPNRRSLGQAQIEQLRHGPPASTAVGASMSCCTTARTARSISARAEVNW